MFDPTRQETPAPFFEVRDISLSLGGQTILDRISFEINEGGIVGLIGPNGSGKTSLMEAVAGFASPQHGEIRWRGCAPAPRLLKEHLFYLPDGVRPCADHLTRDVLHLFQIAFDQPEARLSELVQALGLQGSLGKRVGTLSKGLAKRLLLALGMLTRAPLLLFDEPLDGLDLHQVAVVRALALRLRDENRTLLLSIHELSLAERLCESFILLAEGRVIASGDLAALRARAGVKEGGLDAVFLALT
jgi:ABC-type multidrug transport system ATPase subunit